MAKTGTEHDKNWNRALAKIGIEHGKHWNRALAKIGIEHGVDENKAWNGTEHWQMLEQSFGKDWNRAW